MSRPALRRLTKSQLIEGSQALALDSMRAEARLRDALTHHRSRIITWSALWFVVGAAVATAGWVYLGP